MNRLLERLENGADARPLGDARFLLAGFDPPTARSLRRELRTLQVRLAATCPGVHQLPDIAGMGRTFDSLIVNMDAFSDLETGVDTLLDFRRRASDVVVILISSRVAADDLGTGRAPICDATLRHPVSPERLRIALLAGFGNHQAARRREP